MRLSEVLRRTPSVGNAAGVFESNDGGNSWQSITGDLPAGGYVTFAINPDTQTVYAGNAFVSTTDAFVIKLDPQGSGPVYSTYLGGAALDEGMGIAVDAAGSAYVTGDTDSPDFPVVNPAQPKKRGGKDAFVTALSPNGKALLYSTYLGGTADDTGAAIALDSAGAAYITGTTQSVDFPVAHPFGPAFAGPDSDAFVAKLVPDGSSLAYSTYLGGSSHDQGNSIAVDPLGQAYVAGFTNSSDFPARAAVQASFTGNWDAIVAKLNRDGDRLLYSTFLAGSGYETAQGTFAAGNSYQTAQGIAVDAAGTAYVAGFTDSTDFPLTADAFRRVIDPGVFVAKIADVSFAPAMNGASFATGAVAPGEIVSIFGTALAAATTWANSLPLPRKLSDTVVMFNGVAAPLLYVSPGQINVQVPFEIPDGTTVLVQVVVGNLASTEQIAWVVTAAPGVFSANSQGSGAGAVLHGKSFQSVTDGDPAQPGEVISIYCTGLGALERAVQSGAAPPTPPPQTVVQPQVLIAGKPAAIQYSGVAPGFVGLYQINAQVPADAPAGSQPLQIVVGEVASNVVSVSIH